MKSSANDARRSVIAILAAISLTALAALPGLLADRLVPTAQAAGFTWTGAVSTDWFTPGNWSPAGVPGANDATTINSGTVAIPADVTIATLNFNNGTIQGAGTLTVTAALNWTGGRMNGPGATVIPLGATMNVSTENTKIIEGRTISNNGTIDVSGVGQRFGFCGGNFTVNNAGTMDFGEGGNLMDCNGPAGTMNNTGTLRKSAGADVTLIRHSLNNNGTVEAGAGTLALGFASPSFVTDSSGGGAYKVAAGATLNFAGGAHTLADGSSVTGAGDVTFGFGLQGPTVHVNGGYDVAGTTTITNRGVVNFNGAASVSALELGSGDLGGSGTVTVTGTMNWTGGHMGRSGGGGTTAIAAGAVLNISGPDTKTIQDGRTLTNAGAINHTAAGSVFSFCGSHSTINNAGTFDIQADAGLSLCNGNQAVAFINTGTFKKSAGAGQSAVQAAFKNMGRVEALAGTLSFGLITFNGNFNFKQTAGLTLLDGGAIKAVLPLEISGGALAGAGVVEGNVVNSGTVSPGLAPGAAGTLRVTGDYTQAASGRLRIEIGGATPGSQFDQLILGTDALTKRATLGGILEVQLVNDFTPAASDSFEVARYSSLASQFSEINGLDIGNGQAFTPDYRPNNLVLVSGGAGGDATGCGGPARIWAQVIAPRTARIHNFPGGRLYTGTVLYGNSGGTGAFALITASVKYRTPSGEPLSKPQHVVRARGVSNEPLVGVTDPALLQAFESLPTVHTDTQAGEHSIPVLVFVPPDNPLCRASGGGSGGDGGTGDGGDGGDTGDGDTGDGGTGDGSTGGGDTGDGDGSGGGTGGVAGSTGGGAGNSFGFDIDFCGSCDPGGGSDGGGTGDGGGGGGDTPGPACDPDFISENDIRATQVDVSRIADCLPPIGDFLRDRVPGGANDIFETIEGAMENSGSASSLASFAASTIAGALAPSVPGQDAVEEVTDIANQVLDIADGCQLGPDGFNRNQTRFVFSCDPNDKVGATGAGEAQYISGEVPIPYTIFFENKPEASVPAQTVVITDQLDATKFDLSTFRLGAISFGDRTVIPPPGRSEFNAEVDLRPDKDLIARVKARLDKQTGLVTWRFTSIDPDTLQPTLDPLAGFLPPNRVPAEGEGSVLFTVSPRRDLPSGTEINNQARIIFDTNAPIDTPVWLNTIDNAKPSSQVQPLPATSNTESFTVGWSGADAHSGIANFSVFVSEDGGPFQLWLRNTTDTSAAFQGQQGKTYGFYSLARDNTGNVEDAKASAEATTAVNADASAPVTAAALSRPANAAGWHNADVTVTLSASDLGSGVRDVSYTATGAQSITGETVPGASATIQVTAEGTTEITFFATDNAGNAEAGQTLTIRLDKIAPAISCGAPDGLWHASDVSIRCTADGGASGLVNPSDASFSLVTSVAPDAETADALTDSRTVADRAGNSATAGPVGGNRVDKKAPSISITSPQAGNYLLNKSVTADYACADGGSGVAAGGCAGEVASGGPLDTSTPGAKVFTVQATDGVGNASTLSVNYAMTYGVRALYDQNKAFKSGSTVPIRVELVDAGGANVSSQGVELSALGVALVSNYAPEAAEDAGQANPDDNFRFTTFDGAGGYVFNLKTTGLPTGTYHLIFRVAGDPVVHTTQFVIR